MNDPTQHPPGTPDAGIHPGRQACPAACAGHIDCVQFACERTNAGVIDWRKLGQGLHARFVPNDLAAGIRFVAAIGEFDTVADHLEARIGRSYVDLKLIGHDAVYRDDEGTEHQLDWVTAQDITLARRISETATEHSLTAEPAAILGLEIALDTADSAAVAPIWSALLTGAVGSVGDDLRDPSGRVPILWFRPASELCSSMTNGDKAEVLR